MSRQYNEQLSLLKDLASMIRGRDVQTKHVYTNRGGQQSNLSVTEGLQLWCGVAWDTIPSEVGYQNIYSVINQWLRNILSHPIEDVLDACRELADSMTRVRFSSYDAFKRHHGRDCSWIGELCSPVKWIIEDAVTWSNPDSYRSVRTFFLFLTRLNLITEDFESESVAKFLQNVNRVNTLFEGRKEVCDRLNPYIVRWFGKSDVHILPYAKHGNGRTAEVRGGDVCISKKYACLKSDQLTSYVHFDGPTNGTLDRTSELICVPKDYRRYRTICAEPTTLMFMQQGIAHSLRLAIESSELSRHVTLEDQTGNTFLAQIGSLDGSFATVDLSDASDSVSWDLVRNTFRMTPFLRYFYASRSRRVKTPTGVVVELPMFATMGNALTFPVECIIFAAIVEYSFDLCGIPLSSRTYRVYGDDIVCPTRILPTVLDNLEVFGFKVNNLKTFTGPPGFRESCGGEYLFGYDVSPLRISRRFSPITLENRAAQFQDRVSLANRLYWGGYLMTRGLLLSQLKNSFGLPMFTDDPMVDDCIYSPNPTNYHLPRRWNTSRSKTEYLTPAVRARVKDRLEDWRGIHLDDYRYFEWSRTKEVDRISCVRPNEVGTTTLDVVKPLVYDGSAPASLSKAWRSKD